MNKRARLNYINALSQNVEHKKMYKAKKQWVVAGISFLVATGMGAIGSHLTTHAASTNGNNQQTTSVAPKLASGSASSNVNNQKSTNNMKQSSGSAIQSSANQLHANILANANNSTKVSGNSNSAKPVASSSAENVSAKSKVAPHFNSAYENYLKANPQLADLYKNGATQFASNEVPNVSKKNKPFMKEALGDTQPLKQHISGSEDKPLKYATGKWGTATWIYNNGTFSIQNGTMSSDLPAWLNQSDGSKTSDGAGNGGAISPMVNADHILSIKTSNVKAPTNMTNLFAGDAANFGNTTSDSFNYVKSIDLSGLNTSQTTNMYGLFAGDENLTNLTFGNNFDTSNVTTMAMMFKECVQLKALDLSSFKTQQCSNYYMMFWDTPNLQYLNIKNFHITNSDQTQSMLGSKSSALGIPDQPIREIIAPALNGVADTGTDINNGMNYNAPAFNSGLRYTNPITNQSTSDAVTILNDGGNWINNSDKTLYTIQLNDDLTNQPTGQSISVEGMRNSPYVPVEANQLPQGYSFVQNVGNIATTTGNNTANLDVINNNEITQHNTWGSSEWLLTTAGQLILNGGALETNQVPRSLSPYISDVYNISTKNNPIAPIDASNLLREFTNTDTIDLSGMNFEHTNNVKDIVPSATNNVIYNNSFNTALDNQETNDSNTESSEITSDATKASESASNAESSASASASSNLSALNSAIISVLSDGNYNNNGLNGNDTSLLNSLKTKYNDWNTANSTATSNTNNANVLASALNDVVNGSGYASNSVLTNTDYSLLSSMSTDYSRWNSASTSAQSGSIQAQSASSQADSASKSISNFVTSLSVSSGASLTIQNAIDSAASSYASSIVSNDLVNYEKSASLTNYETTNDEHADINSLVSGSGSGTNSKSGIIPSMASSYAQSVANSLLNNSGSGNNTSLAPISSIASFYANSYAQSMFGSADSNGTVSNVVSSLASSITANYVSNSTFDNLSTELSNYNTVASSATSAYNSVSSAFSTLGLNSSGSYNSSSNTVLSRLSAIEANLGSASSIGTQLSSMNTQLTNSSSSNTIASEVSALDNALGKNLSNASSAISWVETNGINVSNSAASALASAGTNNSLISHINNLSDDNTNLKKAIDGLNNANVEVFYVDKTGKLLSDNGQPAKPQQNVAATPKVLGTLGSLRSGKINLLNSVPMGYHLNPAQKFQLLRNKKHGLGASRVSKQAVLLGSYDPNKQSSQSGNTTSPYIVTYGNYVQYHGTITLNFKSNGETINKFEIPYTSGVGQVGSDLTLFDPNEYINKTSFVDTQGNTHKVHDINDFTLDSSDASPVSIADIQPAKNLSSDSSKPTTMTDNQSHVLNFTANSATDKFSYVIDTPSGYNGTTSLTGSSASSSINGQYDAKVTSGTIKAPSGYSIATSNNGEPTTYNNGTNYQVHITPDNENVDIIYQDADKNGSIIDNGKSSNKISDNVHVPYGAHISDVTKTFNIPSNYELASSSATKRIEATKSNQSITLDIKGKPASQIINGGKAPKLDIPPAPTSDTNPVSDTTNPLNPNSKDNNGADKANTKNGIATINIVLENSKGKNIEEYAKTVDVYKNHQIGTTYSINPNDDTLKPTGYEEATNPSSTPLTGTVNSDGSLSNGVGYFYYQAIPSQIKQIEVTFVNQKGVRIGSDGKPSSSYVQTLSDNTLASIGGVGTTFNIIPHLTAPTGYHFAKTGDNSTFNITIQKGTGAVGLTFRLLSSAPKPNSNANKPSGSASINMNSAQLSSFADEIGTHITITPQSTVNETVDGSALNSLASEVATNNQEISSLANKPTSAASTSINYDYFNNLVNNGVSKLTNAINKDFKSNIKHVHAKPVTPKKTVGKIGKRTYSYLKWLRVVKPLKLYNKNGVAKVVRPRHRITLNVKAAYKVHNYIVFKVSYKHHKYFINANNKAIKNAYLPASHKLVGRRVRVLYNVYANRRKASGRVKTLHKGYKSTIKNIVRIGNYNVTRIQLADGLWISANMNYVEVL